MEQISKEQALKQTFGYDKFREGQEQLINCILEGRDCLGVMPTGAGKSICFQIPAIIQDGIALVISPLISLMKDQVNALTQAGIKAAFINSSLTERQIRLALSNAENGVYKIMYVAPERLETSEFLYFAKKVIISAVTVDEAHCISQWGQDFRPSYIKISAFINNLPVRPPVSAFTATATTQVREDIINLLQLRNPEVLVTGFDRKNLYFGVKKPKDKFKELINFLADKKQKSGIVYCATRKTVAEVCEKLKEAGYNATRYHAGLTDGERRDNQDDFLYDRALIMVATNAFGMGIDKSNVSYVVHYNMPKNIESYYQEAGRAGRDGEAAECVLFYSGQDLHTNMYLIQNGDNEYPDAETEKLIKERDIKRLREMNFYCHTSDCQRAYILKYFNEKAENYCGNCGNCRANFEMQDITEESQKILSCVIKAGERYGATTIIDILRGQKSEKIKRFGLDSLSTFNISTLSEKNLSEIINHLVLNDYLCITDGQYSLLKRGTRAREVLQNDAKIQMKLLKDEFIEKYERKERIRKSTNEHVRQLDKLLFKKLTALRLTIAKEQGVPAFVIFSDSTLTDMCIKLPQTGEEFLKVAGVGQVKFERYGSRFLNAISEFVRGDNVTGELGENFESLKENSGKGVGEEFNEGIGDEEAIKINMPSNPSDIEASEEAVTVSVITDKLNCILLQRGIKKLTGAKINDWLISEGYLKAKSFENGRKFKMPTELGLKIGITSEERIIRGENCFINLFNNEAQRFVFDNIKIDGL